MVNSIKKGEKILSVNVSPPPLSITNQLNLKIHAPKYPYLLFRFILSRFITLCDCIGYRTMVVEIAL